MNHRNNPSALPCIVLTTSLAAFATAANGQFKEAQPYAEVSAGVQMLDSSSAAVKGLPLDLKVEFEPGYRAEGHFGYAFRKGAEIGIGDAAIKVDMAAEFETGLSQNEISTIGIDLSKAHRSFDLVQVPMLANFILRFPVNEQFHVDVGGGAGVVMKFVTATHPSADASSVGLGWDAFVKASYDVSPHFSVGGFWKCIGVSSTDLPSGTRVSSGALTLRPKEIEDTIGLVFGAFAAWTF